jgi:hypothetical protein
MILNGWKEIAQHVGRGVRTVQRWENEGLPVRRPVGRPRTAVLAFSDEVDGWLHGPRSATLASVAEMGYIEERGFSLQSGSEASREMSTLQQQVAHINAILNAINTRYGTRLTLSQSMLS